MRLGVLGFVPDSQWIPKDRRFWRGDNYLDFLEARKELLWRT